MPKTAKALNPLLWESKILVPAIKAAGVTVWSWNVDTDAPAMGDNVYDLCGIQHGVDVSFEDLSANIHPAATGGCLIPQTSARVYEKHG